MSDSGVYPSGGSANDLVARCAERYDFEENELLNTLAQTAFRRQNGSVPTRMICIVSDFKTYDESSTEPELCQTT